MALLADRVKETTTTTGTGTVSLAGAPAGFQSFNTAFANGSLVYYVIQGGAEWEIGIGTTGTGTLARTQVLQSSNADALVPFSAGVKDVFCSYVADRAVTTVDAATLTNKTIDDYTNNIGANSTHFRIKATGTLSKGTVVKATGYNPGENAIEVAVVTSATDLVLGISEQALTAGQFGLAVVIGELMDVNTNGLTVGGIIYSDGSGGFTQTKPSSGTYQPLGWVVRANASTGVLAVNVVAPLYVETSTNTANTAVLRDGSGNFAAGTITATLSGTATQVSQALTAGSYLTSTGTYNGGTARTFAVDATDANTASKVVARDASGNFSAGTITATLNGAAPAGSLTGTTLASGVTASSLTSVGTLSSLTVSGNVTIDTNTLFVDATNNRVGILQASPTETGLHIGSTTTGGNARLVSSSYGNNGLVRFFGTDGLEKMQGGALSNTTAYFGTLASVDFLLFAGGSERARLDASGNLGLGVTPSAWGSGRVALQIGGTPYIVGPNLDIGSNFYVDSGGYKYATTGVASRFDQNAGAHRWFTAPSGAYAGDPITFVQAMTLDASGRLGIGETSPAQRLVVRDTSAAPYVSFIAGASSAMGILMGTSGNTIDGQIVYSNSTQAMTFVTGTTERARITSGGYFKASNAGTYEDAAGTYHEMRSSTSGSAAMRVSHSAASGAYGAYIRFTGGSPDDNTQWFLACDDTTTVRCYIYSDGDLANHDGVYGTISDAALKQDIIDATSQWADIKAVRFRKYRMKTDVAADANAPYQLGVIAQELEATSPGLVDEHPNEDGTTTKTVKSSILLMKAAVALQEAMARIETLEQRVLALEA